MSYARLKIEEFSVKSVMCSFKKIFIPTPLPHAEGTFVLDPSSGISVIFQLIWVPPAWKEHFRKK